MNDEPVTAQQEGTVAGGGLDREAVRRHIEELTAERDAASAEAEHMTAGMREVALFRAANAQGCLGNYARPLLDALEAAEAQRDELRAVIALLLPNEGECPWCALMEPCICEAAGEWSAATFRTEGGAS